MMGGDTKFTRASTSLLIVLLADVREGGALHPSKPSSSRILASASSLLDVDRLKQAIALGRVYQQPGFLSEDQVQVILREIREMESQNRFQRKGLSNTVLGQNQTFDAKLDRSICPVPWFNDALEGSDIREIPSKLRELQHSLSQALDRPSMALTTAVNHECYYSKSEVGSRLPRHMDERHEETKGAKGWLLPSRRSLSWLIYLSTPADWTLATNGGALRTYPQQKVLNDHAPPTHDGNLQVGWLVGDGNTSGSRAVYLDSWHPVVGVVAEGTVPEPHCVLYIVDREGKREYVTRPWLTEQLQGLPMMDFMKLAAEHDANASKEPMLLFLQASHAATFAPLEDRAAWDAGQAPRGSETIDIVPLRGSLVVFDSVQLPHQVEIIESGTRLALAGWFHEKTQEFPEDFYGSAM